MLKKVLKAVLVFIPACLVILAVIGLVWFYGGLWSTTRIKTETREFDIRVRSNSHWNAYDEGSTSIFIVNTDKTEKADIVQEERTKATYNVRAYAPGELTLTILSYVNWYPGGEQEESVEIAGVRFDVARLMDGQRQMRVFLNEDRTLEVMAWWMEEKDEIKPHSETLKSLVKAFTESREEESETSGN